MNNNQWDYDYSKLYNNVKNPDAAKDEQQTEFNATGYEQTNNYTPNDNMPQKDNQSNKKGFSAKRAGAFALAVVLCGAVGVGGGYLGGSLAVQGISTSPSTVINQVTSDGLGGGAISTSDSGLTVSQIAAMVSDSVVEVTTEYATTNSFFNQYVTDGAGSGVIISSDGYIITNNHVVSGAQQIKVTLNDKTEYIATLVGTDSQTDVAVLKIDANNLSAATIGDSSNISVGDFALAVGNPLGTLGGTVTDGIISALDREVIIDNQSMTLLQTNAAVSPGNSGGGLFNSRGELIGIVNAKSSASNTEGLGFAIPINTAISVAQDLINNGYVTGRPALGINVVSITDAQTAAQYGVSRAGVYIVGVNAGGAAEAAGLQAGDLIMSVDDTIVSTTSDVTSALESKAVGDEIVVQVVRDNKLLSVTVVLQERAANADQQASEATESFTNPELVPQG